MFLKKILYKNIFYFIFMFFLILILIFGTRIGFVFFSISNFILGGFVLKSSVFYKKTHILLDENEYIEYVNKDDFSKKKKRDKEAFSYFVYGVIFLLTSIYSNIKPKSFFKIIIIFAVISIALLIYLSEKQKNKIKYITYSILLVICCISFLSIYFLVLYLIK